MALPSRAWIWTRNRISRQTLTKLAAREMRGDSECAFRVCFFMLLEKIKGTDFDLCSLTRLLKVHPCSRMLWLKGRKGNIVEEVVCKYSGVYTHTDLPSRHMAPAASDDDGMAPLHRSPGEVVADEGESHEPPPRAAISPARALFPVSQPYGHPHVSLLLRLFILCI
ncbi:hypothetical protein QYE76_049455 [Lolium multiflorum]|uniref:Uncharacterized protein n=1 Tax=Lolium multiflorum TaxID=4521 RepID=A0AAD8SPZ4_LOLMU|nr:hypothetical protein QYE76_049455 [Lolium multiflorum]